VNARAILVVVSFLVAGPWLSTSIADIQDWIFADEFESGDASAWSASNGPYLVIPGAASDGAFGLRVPAVFAEPAWVLDDSPSDDPVVRSDFDINFDGLGMLEGDAFDFYAGYVVHNTEPAFIVSLERLNDQFNIVLTAWANGGIMLTSAPVTIPGSGWHRMAVEYGVATSPLGEGELRVFLDGAPLTNLADFDNSGFVINTLQLGAINGVDPTTSGSFDVDVYTSVRLFNPWPCATSGSGDPEDGNPLCLDVEGKSTGIAVGGCGDGVVVWKGAEDVDVGESRLGGIYGKPVRGSLGEQLSTYPIAQDESARTPDVDMDDHCNSAVAWSSSLDGEGVFTAVFDVNGTQISPLTQVSEGTDAEESPAVAAANDGSYLVAWRRTHNSQQSVHGRFFAPDASPIGPEFPADLGGGQTSFPDAAMNGDGASVIIWEAEGKVTAHGFDPSGGSLGIFSVAPGPNDGSPAVAMVADGGFAAVWTRLTTDRKVFLRLFDSDGAPVSDEIRVDTLDPADGNDPDIDIGADGELSVVWSSTFAGATTILGRVFASDGTPIEEPFPVETRGRVWLPTAPRAAAAERLLVSYSTETDYYGYSRGALVGARSESVLFFDGFESGDLSAWSLSTP